MNRLETCVHCYLSPSFNRKINAVG